VHERDGLTPVEETIDALDSRVRSGKVRYVGCSNYSGWHLMSALAAADRHGYQRFVSQQIYYSLQGARRRVRLVPNLVAEGSAILSGAPSLVAS
jgi:aryl-alcohol dehydrogenase-like predicted oxidoreductase